MNDKQRTFGQYDTPADVADLLLAFCLRKPTDRLLDPSCGAGAFLTRAAQMQTWLAPNHPLPFTLWGVELDSEPARLAQSALPQAHIIKTNFFRLQPGSNGPFGNHLFDAIIGNPPYTRAEWIDRLNQADQAITQLAIFDDRDGLPRALSTGRHPARSVLNRRSGLHAYFFIHGAEFLREGGRFGFVVPNSWLDVAYGERLKQFLLDHFRILAIIESSVERWFSEARVNTCLVVLEKCSQADERAGNQVHLVHLLRPLAELIPFEPDASRRLVALEELAGRLLPGRDSSNTELVARVIMQADLSAEERWGVAMRAPAIYRRARQATNLVPLGSWAAIHRGYTTGANSFFYLDPAVINKWAIESQYRRPLLKSLRHVTHRTITAANSDQQIIYIPTDADISGTAVGAYVAWGETQGFDRRTTCANRQPWYSLPDQEEAHLLLAKGIWQRHFAPLLLQNVLVDQQLYRLRLAEGIPLVAAAAILNSAWLALQMELHGRVNFGEGVLWLAGYELLDLRVPDPRYMLPGQLTALTDAFEPLLELPVIPVQEEANNSAWQAYNFIASEIFHFSDEEALAVNQALLERMNTRRLKARSLEAGTHTYSI